MVTKKKTDDLELFLSCDIDIRSKTIFLGSNSYFESTDVETGTDFQMAEKAIKGLFYLDRECKDGEHITIIMNNLGGDKYHGVAIYDAIQACNSHVKITAMGQCMSMGAVILQAGDERLLSQNCKLMIHYGTWGCYDHPKNFYNWAEEGKKYDAWMRSVFMEKLQKANPLISMKKLDKMLDFDTILNAQESINIGLADRILDKFHEKN